MVAARSGGAAILLLFALGTATASAAPPRTVRIGFVLDGPWNRGDEILERMRAEIRDLLDAEYDIQFPDDKLLVADWTTAGVNSALQRLVNDPGVDLVVAFGVLASDRACRGPAPPKPVVAPVVIDAHVQGLPSRDGTSGVHNLSYLSVPTAVERDLRLFHDIVPFHRVAILGNAYLGAALPELGERVHAVAAGLGLEPSLIRVGTSATHALARLPADAQAVYILPLLQLSASGFDSLVAGLTARRLPTFSTLGEKEVQRGVLAGASPDLFPHMARRLAVTVQRILAGEDPGAIPTGIAVGEHLMINARIARAIGWYPSWAGLSEAEVVDEVEPQGRTLTLVDAMREALAANVDLAVAVRQTRAGSAVVSEDAPRRLSADTNHFQSAIRRTSELVEHRGGGRDAPEARSRSSGPGWTGICTAGVGSLHDPNGADSMQREALENRTDAGPPRPTATAGTLARARRVIRRRYWVDWRSQLPIIVLGVGSTLFFVVMFNLTLLALSAARRDAIIESVPAMEERLLQQDIAFHRRIYVASGCLVVFVNIGLLVLTQRSAGPIRRIESHLRRIAAGDLDHQVRLRKRDHLHSLADHCNQVIEALRARAQAEVVSLAQAERALRSGGPAERQAAGAALERLLRDKQGVPAAAHPAPEPGAPVTV